MYFNYSSGWEASTDNRLNPPHLPVVCVCLLAFATELLESRVLLTPSRLPPIILRFPLFDNLLLLLFSSPSFGLMPEVTPAWRDLIDCFRKDILARLVKETLYFMHKFWWSYFRYKTSVLMLAFDRIQLIMICTCIYSDKFCCIFLLFQEASF